ncbi:MAG: TIGR03905 family TSCPD domain-containing protein [Oscillospiraceae bacterium]|nr:TIGR03905 family TSCPD domain-containing protein [Oscillospiraceae bacterium]
MKINYRPQGVCPIQLSFDLNGDVVTNVAFVGGCNGNLKAVSKLVDGMNVSQIEEKLHGNTCGNKMTSCADQLARAVRQAYDEQNA